MFRLLWNDESGVIISAELVLVLTIAVLGSVVGLSSVAIAVNQEMKDVGNAFGGMNQSYGFTGFWGCSRLSFTSGSGFIDDPDVCNGTASVVGNYVQVSNSGG